MSTVSSGPAALRRAILVVAVAVAGGLLCLPTPAFAATQPTGAVSKPSLEEQVVQWRAAASAAPIAAKAAPVPGLAQPPGAATSLSSPYVPTMCGPRLPSPTPPGGAPFETWSRYIGGTTDLLQMGFDQGCASDQQRGYSSSLHQIVILDFGDPGIGSSGAFGAWDRAGFHYIGSTSQVNSIEWSAARYMLGFWNGTVAGSGSFMTVMVGTNNHKYNANGSDNGAPVNYAHGQAWARMVRDLQGWISNNGFGSQLQVEAADDMETSWAFYSQTLDWANGFTSVGTAQYYDYGDAGGCPTNSSGNCLAGPLNGGRMGWSTANEYTLAWSLLPAYAVPEIYNTSGDQAHQWYQISLWGPNNHHPKISFTAALSQFQVCACGNTYYQSWSQLQNLVNSDQRTSIGRIPYTSEVSTANP